MATLATRMATLVIHDEKNGTDVTAPVGNSWQPLVGRPGVEVFHVPNPSGAGGLFLSVCRIAPGSGFDQSSIDQSQLVTLLAGDVTVNGRTYTPGQCMWFAPGEPTSWSVQAGYLGVVFYDAPPPDIDFTDIIIPIKP